MKLTTASRIFAENPTKPVAHALAGVQRDMMKVLKSGAAGGDIILQRDPSVMAECYRLTADENNLILAAADDLGFVYGLYEISRRFLGVPPFWFWNDWQPVCKEEVEIPTGFAYESRPARVRYRGWFINDETLIMNWKVERRADLPWEMVFESLLRLGGNLVIPGTDTNSKLYRGFAAERGLILTHHHAEPLGAEMFVRAYPGEEPSFDKNADKFRALWQQGIEDQKNWRVVWNIGFRGQGDRPFWLDDPQYDSPAKRGALISSLMREQYDMVRKNDPNAVCCTNLYGETMELYRDDYLDLPEDVIKIWADNGFGKMVSRRQENNNPRVPALPPLGDTGAHGLYYHASFYDLQAASHITLLPNSADFVRRELTDALAHGVDDYWLINCSNIKPHSYMLDFIAELWQNGEADSTAHARRYAAEYYSEKNADAVAARLLGFAEHAVSYGPNEDDHAGDQFYNHVPRMLMSQFMADRTRPSEHLRWLCDLPTLEAQVAWCAEKFAQACDSYDAYLRECERTAAEMNGAARTLFQDNVLLQAQLYALWAQAGRAVCEALRCGFAGDWVQCFHQAGLAKQDFALANRAMRDREHGKWIDFYANECQTDVKQSALVCGYLMSFARNMGEGPHFFHWQREFQDSEADRRVMLLLNTVNHPTDEELWRLMEQRFGI